jgi:esterase/lipase superfamily enzyme
MRKWFAFLASALLAGCGGMHPFMIPAPALVKHPDLDLYPRIPPAFRTTQVPVYYATTRAADPVEHYSDDAGDGLRFGVAQVRLGEPGWTWEQLVASDAADTLKKPRPGAVESVREMDDRALVASINAQLDKANNREVVFYVHGYRVFFDEVTVMMGSWSHYLGHGALATFQWPTGQKFWNYLTDCPRAEKYIPDIERTISLLSQTRATGINIIAYSCGSPLLGAALAGMRARHPQESAQQLKNRYRINNVIFAASDVDLKTFAEEHLPAINDLARQTIVYFSRKDAALGFSSLIAGASRLGRPDINDLSVRDLERLGGAGLQAIDVTEVRGAHELGGMRGHGYWYANDWISTDVLLSLRFTLTPQQRCLEQAGQRSVWRLSDDYVDCLARRIVQNFPELKRAGPR